MTDQALAEQIVTTYESGFIGKQHRMVRRPGLVKLITTAFTTLRAEEREKAAKIAEEWLPAHKEDFDFRALGRTIREGRENG